MKVTVCFEDVRVVVPCGTGQCQVKDLVEDAIARYHKVLAKSVDVGWLTVNNVRLLTADGGILDPDDCVSDVIDDKEQLIAVHEEGPDLLGNRHHNNGDGTSASSFGTSSPDSFREATNDSVGGSSSGGGGKRSAQTSGTSGELDRLTPDRHEDKEIFITTENLPNESTLAAAWNGKEAGLRSSAVSDTSDHSTDCTVVSALQQLQLRNRQLRPTNNSVVVVPAAAPEPKDAIDRREPVGGSTSVNINVESRVPETENKRIDPPNNSAPSQPAQNNVGLNQLCRTMIVEFPKSVQPLGIHVVPEFDECGRNIGLTIQSLEVGGRAERDGKLRCGDRVTEINGTSLFEKEFAAAQDIFRHALQSSNLEMTIVRRIQPSVVIGRGGHHTPSTSIASAKSSEDGTQSQSSGSAAKKVAPPVPTRKYSQQSHLSDSNNNSACIVRKTLSVDLVKGDEGLGFTVTTRAGHEVGRCFVYVKNILPNGAAIKDGRLMSGDLLLEINGQSMTSKTQNDAVAMLRNTPPGGTVRLVINRQFVENSSPADVQRRSVKSTQQTRPVSTLGFAESTASTTTEQQSISSARSSTELSVDRSSSEEVAESSKLAVERLKADYIRRRVGVSEVSAGKSAAERLGIRNTSTASNVPSRLTVADVYTAPAAAAAGGSGVPTSLSSSDRISIRSDASTVPSKSSRSSAKVSSDNASEELSGGSLELPLRSSDSVRVTGSRDMAGQLTINSRKSLSLDNLRSVAEPESPTEESADDLIARRAAFARNINQSFRVAVDKSYDAPTLTSAKSESELKFGKKKKIKKEDGKGGFGRFFRFSRSRSKSGPQKGTSKESGSVTTNSGLVIDSTVIARRPNESRITRPSLLAAFSDKPSNGVSISGEQPRPTLHPEIPRVNSPPATSSEPALPPNNAQFSYEQQHFEKQNLYVKQKFSDVDNLKQSQPADFAKSTNVYGLQVSTTPLVESKFPAEQSRSTVDGLELRNNPGILKQPQQQHLAPEDGAGQHISASSGRQPPQPPKKPARQLPLKTYDDVAGLPPVQMVRSDLDQHRTAVGGNLREPQILSAAETAARLDFYDGKIAVRDPSPAVPGKPDVFYYDVLIPSPRSPVKLSLPVTNQIDVDGTYRAGLSPRHDLSPSHGEVPAVNKGSPLKPDTSLGSRYDVFRSEKRVGESLSSASTSREVTPLVDRRDVLNNEVRGIMKPTRQETIISYRPSGPASRQVKTSDSNIGGDIYRRAVPAAAERNQVPAYSLQQQNVDQYRQQLPASDGHVVRFLHQPDGQQGNMEYQMSGTVGPQSKVGYQLPAGNGPPGSQRYQVPSVVESRGELGYRVPSAVGLQSGPRFQAPSAQPLQYVHNSSRYQIPSSAPHEFTGDQVPVDVGLQDQFRYQMPAAGKFQQRPQEYQMPPFESQYYPHESPQFREQPPVGYQYHLPPAVQTSDDSNYRASTIGEAEYIRQHNQPPQKVNDRWLNQQPAKPFNYRIPAAGLDNRLVSNANWSNGREDLYHALESSRDNYRVTTQSLEPSPVIKYNQTRASPALNPQAYGPPRLAEPSHLSPWS